MKSVSDRRLKREADARPVRHALLNQLAACEFCGRKERSAWPTVAICVHEIARGSTRQAALDQRYAVLVLCDDCHPLMDRLPRAAQLAILKLSRLGDFDLHGFWRLTSRIYPDESEVDLWVRRLSMDVK